MRGWVHPSRSKAVNTSVPWRGGRESPGKSVAVCVPRSSLGFNNQIQSRKLGRELHKVIQSEVGHYPSPRAVLDVALSPKDREPWELSADACGEPFRCRWVIILRWLSLCGSTGPETAQSWKVTGPDSRSKCPIYFLFAHFRKSPLQTVLSFRLKQPVSRWMMTFQQLVPRQKMYKKAQTMNVISFEGMNNKSNEALGMSSKLYNSKLLLHR